MLEYELRDYLLKRIDNMPKDIYEGVIKDLNIYGIQTHDIKGKSILIDSLILNFDKTAQLLFENDIPDENGIRQQLVYFISTIQTVVGIRRFSDFLRLAIS